MYRSEQFPVHSAHRSVQNFRCIPRHERDQSFLVPVSRLVIHDRTKYRSQCKSVGHGTILLVSTRRDDYFFSLLQSSIFDGYKLLLSTCMLVAYLEMVIIGIVLMLNHQAINNIAPGRLY
jgi:hypothetical protein